MCTFCNDTGSLAKDLDGQLDCTRCGVATERAALEAWAVQSGIRCPAGALWLIYQHGRRERVAPLR